MSKLALEKLQAKLGSKVLETHSHLGDDTAVVSADAWHEAAKTLRGIEGMEILETSATVEGEKIKEYRTHVRIRFRLER